MNALASLLGTDSRRLRRLLRVLAGCGLAAVLAVVAPTWWTQVRPAPAWTVPGERVDAALAALEDLAVVEPRPLAGYDRDHFGPPWFDVDGNGCDTRNDQLAHWLTGVVVDQLQPCVVVSGMLHDPYTGHTIPFERGPETSGLVQIDHVVALADAWSKGAHDWPPMLALGFANDPANLIAVDGAANQDKGASDAAHWLPPDDRFHCAYAVQQTLIKAAYGLGVTSAELGALGDVIQACPRDASARGPQPRRPDARVVPGQHPPTTMTSRRCGCRSPSAARGRRIGLVRRLDTLVLGAGTEGVLHRVGDLLGDIGALLAHRVPDPVLSGRDLLLHTGVLPQRLGLLLEFVVMLPAGSASQHVAHRGAHDERHSPLHRILLVSAAARRPRDESTLAR